MGCRMAPAFVQLANRDLAAALDAATASRYREGWAGTVGDETLRSSEAEPDTGAGAVKVEQMLPPPETACFVAPCVAPELQQEVIELFRGQFSPDMHNIFPLLVQARQAHGLDFRSCQTWILFANGEPAGGVTFRVHEPLTHGAQTVLVPVLEVLFIAVQERARNRKFGSALVQVLETEAMAAGVRLMYVEIGQGQEQARAFWQANGMHQVRPLLKDSPDYSMDTKAGTVGIPTEVSQFFENRCLRFDDTEQWVKQVAGPHTGEQGMGGDAHASGQHVLPTWDLFPPEEWHGYV